MVVDQTCGSIMRNACSEARNTILTEAVDRGRIRSVEEDLRSTGTGLNGRQTPTVGKNSVGYGTGSWGLVKRISA